MSRTTRATQPRDRSRRGFVLRRLHALSGVVPLGVFTVVHLVATGSALFGRDTFDAWMRLGGSTLAIVAETVFVLLPLAFHAGFGTWLALRSRYDVRGYPFNKTWGFVAQRVSGLVALAFVVAHVRDTWGKKLGGSVAPEQAYDALVADLSSTHLGFPIRATFYAVGVACCVFHFAYGLTTFARGATARPSTTRLVRTIAIVGGTLLGAIGVLTVVHLATGSLDLGGDR